jgi:hypothetical protein
VVCGFSKNEKPKTENQSRFARSWAPKEDRGSRETKNRQRETAFGLAPNFGRKPESSPLRRD